VQEESKIRDGGFTRIIAATDLSESGGVALHAGSALAVRAGARLSVMSVVEPPRSPEMLYPAPAWRNEWVDQQQDLFRRRIEEELEEVGLGSALIHVSVGDPANLISAFAHKLRSNLLVVGAHRLSRFERILAGSTGERILRHSGCPVMIATPDGEGPFKRILVAVDLSRDSRAVLDSAERLAECDGSEVQVVYSETSSKGLMRKVTFQGHRSKLLRDRLRFEALVREAHMPRQPLCTVLHGHAGRAVLSEARNWGADLIVLGARRWKGLASTRLGRTSRYVLRHGDRSIVVVPT
jgi:nucleotide-binding universal stress UspA family protein